MGICASISSISILQDAFFHGSCALYSVFYFLNSVIEHTSLFWLQAMPSCVRAPYQTSEPSAMSSVRPPLVHTLARPTVCAYLSNFPNVHCVLLHPTLYVVASHKVLTSRIHGGHRSRVVLQVPGPQPRVTHFHGHLCWSTCHSTSRDIRSPITKSPGLYLYVTVIIPHEFIRRLQLYLMDA
jgi:hypothetical protein